jgi:hypothetical protein
MKKTLRLLVTALFLTALVLPFTACEKDGPAEEIGEEIDDAVDEVTDN